MKIFYFFCFLFGFCIGWGGMELRAFFQRKRSKKEYQDYLARCCKSCGGLLKPGEICECLAFNNDKQEEKE